MLGHIETKDFNGTLGDGRIAVERFQEGGLAATARPHQRIHRLVGNKAVPRIFWLLIKIPLLLCRS